MTRFTHPIGTKPAGKSAPRFVRPDHGDRSRITRSRREGWSACNCAVKGSCPRAHSNLYRHQDSGLSESRSRAMVINGCAARGRRDPGLLERAARPNDTRTVLIDRAGAGVGGRLDRPNTAARHLASPPHPRARKARCRSSPTSFARGDLGGIVTGGPSGGPGGRADGCDSIRVRPAPRRVWDSATRPISTRCHAAARSHPHASAGGACPVSPPAAKRSVRSGRRTARPRLVGARGSPSAASFGRAGPRSPPR